MCILLLIGFTASSGLAQTHHISDSPSDPNLQIFSGAWWDTGNYVNGHEIYRTLGELTNSLPPGVTVTDVWCSVYFTDGLGNGYDYGQFFDNGTAGFADMDFIMDYPGASGWWTMVSFEWRVDYSNGESEDIIDDYY